MKTERTLWTGAQIYDTERACFCPGSLLVRDGLVEAVLPPMQTTQIDAQTRQANGCLLVPGLVDVHTHGRLGFDFCDATAEQMRQMRRSYALDGTTTLLPTIASAPFAQMLQAVQRVQEAGFDGVHIEGRYLSPIRRGAHAPRLLCLPQPAEAELLQKRFALYAAAAAAAVSATAMQVMSKRYRHWIGDVLRLPIYITVCHPCIIVRPVAPEQR